ncbi:cytochrome P450 [Novosphingobium percolationis]|uniref:cytochrome P450 n=1 Tax=Novosphingobium percolationis TaxID=2871811 RepID=UPI001CD31D0D|nr:cytochrome P450 [Novosphingobium percolationis]
MSEAATLARPPAGVPQDRIVDFDIYNPFHGQHDLHVAWTQLRDSTPHEVVWTPYNEGHWIALSPDLINQVYSDATRFSSRVVLVPKSTAGEAYGDFIPLSLDPPEHRPFRKVLNDKLYGSAIHPLEPKVRKLTVDLIESFVANGRCDFVHEFAEELPLRVFMQLVDLPVEHLPKLKHLADQFTRPDGSITPAQATEAFKAYVHPIIEERKAKGGNDLLTHIATSEVNGRPMTESEAARLAIQVLVGGLDTVVNFMSFTMRLLAQAPEVQARLAANHDLHHAAINECLRRLPLVSSAREVVADVEVDGVTLARGDMIVAPTELYALNPEMNADPLKYDLDRKVRNHMAFGSGNHTCPGQFLARMEMKVLLEEWFARIPRFELEPGQTLRHRGGIVGGCEPFVLRWDVG